MEFVKNSKGTDSRKNYRNDLRKNLEGTEGRIRDGTGKELVLSLFLVHVRNLKGNGGKGTMNELEKPMKGTEKRPNWLAGFFKCITAVSSSTTNIPSSR